MHICMYVCVYIYLCRTRVVRKAPHTWELVGELVVNKQCVISRVHADRTSKASCGVLRTEWCLRFLVVAF